MTLLLLLTLVYIVLLSGFLPLFNRKQSEAEYVSSVALDLLREAEIEKKEGNSERAIKLLEIYLSIDEGNEAIAGRRDRYRADMAEGDMEKQAGEAAEPVILSRVAARGQSASDLLEKAREYYDGEDYFSAHYYAALTLEIAKERSLVIAARRIERDALKELSSILPTGADKEAEKLFLKKKEGFLAFTEERFFDAYYIFKELAENYSRDPDVLMYLDKSTEKLKEESFFTEEAEKAVALPGKGGILFKNESAEGRVEIIAIERMVELSGDVFFKDVEAISFDSSGEINYHLHAPYGKLVNNHLNMNAMDRLQAGKSSPPVYWQGGENDLLPIHSIKLSPERELLSRLSMDSQDLKGWDLISLWQAREKIETFGLVTEKLDIILLMTLLKPFLFLILSLISISLGWSLRTRYLARPPIIPLLFIPLFPLVVFFLVMVICYGHKLLLGFLLLSFGFWPALITLCILESLLLMISLLTLAAQKSE
ncbi:MAG: hypothetical protein GH155_01935 [Spirochaeta sp.]|nr:hypothetical protein [Spirochaeta sp.]